ncbi:MAG: hypothetical protein NXY57DRAFT_310863 [Lentinula lateritia]|nr:MAG: hypothetical protein NXY57DRAFT_310863 [Lentinula lateritia]
MIIFLLSFLRITPVAASSFNTSLNCQSTKLSSSSLCFNLKYLKCYVIKGVDKKHSLYRIASRSAPECSSSDKRVTVSNPTARENSEI